MTSEGVPLWLMAGKREPAKLAETGKGCLPRGGEMLSTE
jgi:hypothetical protein